LSGNSPDVIYINRGEYATLGVDVIRSMHADVYVAPNDCEKKVYVIEEAHLMTTQAQNALLLILEEPPSYVQFLLLCDSAEALLETVRSRAPVLRLQPIDRHLLDEHLCRTVTEARMLKSQSPDEFEELLIASGGSVGIAKMLLDPNHRKPILERRAAAREFVSLCGTGRNSLPSLSYLCGLGTKRESVIRQLEENLICLRDLLVCKQTEQASLCFFAKREEACELSYRFSTPELFRISEGLERAITRIQANANVRLTMTQLAIEIGMMS
jgi:DNA polymerase-3 subunit delta'